MNIPRFLAKFGPWLVALAPAWFVYDTLTVTYEVPMWIAVPIAAGIELTGITSYHTFTRLYAWNRQKRKVDPDAPTWIAVLSIIGYVIVGIALTALIKGNWTLGLFFLLAAVGYITIALNISQDEREREIGQAKAAAKLERHERHGEHSADNPEIKRTILEYSPEFDEHLRLIREYSQGSPFSHTNVQEWTQIQRTSAYKLIGYGKQIGVIHQLKRGLYIYRNGTN